MSRKKIQNNTNIILERVRLRYHLDNGDKALSVFFGVEKNTISAWRQRDSIPEEKLINTCGYESLQWLLTGKEPENHELEESPAVYTSTNEKHVDVLNQVKEILDSGDDFVVKALLDRLKDYRNAVAANSERRKVQQRLDKLESELKAIRGEGGPPGERRSGAGPDANTATDTPTADTGSEEKAM